MRKALAILASPRAEGNVSKMLQIAVQETKNQQYEVNFINLYEKDIAFCKGCMACKQTGKCIIEDDIQEISLLFKESDLVIIACPTYFANVTAPLKNMLDRLVSTFMDDNHHSLPKGKLSKKQSYILITACNTPFPFSVIAHQSSGCIKAMKEALHISGMKQKGTITFSGTRNKKEIPSKIEKKIRKLVRK